MKYYAVWFPGSQKISVSFLIRSATSALKWIYLKYLHDEYADYDNTYNQFYYYTAEKTD